MDQTMKHQENNKDYKNNNSDAISKVSSGKIVHYSCIIKPTNTSFLDSSTQLYRILEVCKLYPSVMNG